MAVTDASKAAAVSVSHDNQTGRYLPVFHAGWDPKWPRAFVVGSMAKHRSVEVFAYSAANSSKPGKGASASAAAGRARLNRVGLLRGDALASVQSRNCFHPQLDVLVCANSSGRVHIFD